MTRPAALQGNPLPGWLDTPRGLFLLCVLYGLAWVTLLTISTNLWFLPAGLRLGALWLVPTRRWPWLAIAEWSTFGLLGLSDGWRLEPGFFAMNLLPWLIYAGVVRVVRGNEQLPRLDDARRMLQLISAGIIGAALVSPVLQASLPGAGERSGGIAGLFSFLYGDFLGQLVIAPILVLLAHADLRKRGRRGALWMDLAVQLMFSMAVFWLIRQRHDLEPYILLVAFAPIFFVAFRQGWEGAVISVALVGLLVQGLQRFAVVPIDITFMQLSLAVVGGGGLILGAASSELRRSHERVAQRHRELVHANDSLTEAAADLRNVSQRLVRLEEQGQRELAVELDYELGRSIHALSTRISLAFRDIRDEQMLRLLESMREQVREMQESLRRVLRQLRPQALDTHGLREALGFGPLREMLEDAGIAYETAFYGRVEALKDDAQTTVYRICQAAVREAARSQASRRVMIRLDVVPGEGERLGVHLQIDIETTTFVEYPIESGPLPAITDRVLSQHGSYQVEALASGVRHRIEFEEVGSTLL